MASFPVVRGVRLRATRADACGMPIAGPRSRLVTDAWVTLTLSPVMRDATDIEQANADGRICVADRTPPERKWWAVGLELCKVDTCLLTMFTDWETVTDWEGNDIGMSDQKEVPSTTGVALEVWTGVGAEDTCDVPTTDDILTGGAGSTLPYGYFVIPVTKEAQLGDIEIGASASTFTVNAITAEGTRWGRGPYNVMETDASNTAGRLLKAFKKGQHLRWFKTKIGPPEVTDGCCGLVLASPFYGETAQEIAPSQPACGAVASNEVQSVTFSGTTSLAFLGESTTPLGVASLPAAVQAALEALPTIGVGNVTVTGTAPGPFAVTFVQELSQMNLPPLVANTPANASISTTTPGGVYP